MSCAARHKAPVGFLPCLSARPRIPRGGQPPSETIGPRTGSESVNRVDESLNLLLGGPTRILEVPVQSVLPQSVGTFIYPLVLGILVGEGPAALLQLGGFELGRVLDGLLRNQLLLFHRYRMETEVLTESAEATPVDAQQLLA